LALLDGPSASAFGELGLGFWVSQGNWKRANSINIQKLEGIGWTSTACIGNNIQKIGASDYLFREKLREEGEKD
jgi:hypothetical protein